MYCEVCGHVMLPIFPICNPEYAELIFYACHGCVTPGEETQ